METKDFLEPEFRENYTAWKTTPSPATNRALIGALDPIVRKGMQMYAKDDPVVYGKARLMAWDAVKKYDPAKAPLQSHILTHMQGLRRATNTQQNFVRIPERIAMESHRLNEETQRLQDEFGRLPTDAEVSDALGVSLQRLAKIRSAKSGYASSQVQDADTQESPGSHVPGRGDSQQLWTQIVYDDLSPIDQKIMEHALGLNGQERLSNQAIAAKLGRSPGAITQRKARIQQLLDRESELSPFLGE